MPYGDTMQNRLKANVIHTFRHTPRHERLADSYAPGVLKGWKRGLKEAAKQKRAAATEPNAAYCANEPSKL